jgi:hypothetical protein
MIGMYNSIILKRHCKKGSRKGRFKISEKSKKFWEDNKDNYSTKEYAKNYPSYKNSRNETFGLQKHVRHNRKLTIGNGTNKVNYQDYKMKVFNCDKATKKMYEEYYKTHSYT